MAVVGITVTYNSAADLGKLLDSVRGQLDELVVVDNNSSDGTDAIAARYDFVTLIENGTNLGFARAVNIALERAAGRDVVLLNPDVVCSEHAIQALAEVASELGDRFIVAPRLRYSDGRLQESVRSFPTLIRLLARRTPFGRTRRGAEIHRRHVAQTAGSEPVPVDWVIGAVMFLPAAVLQLIGRMDERFFLYCEDLDWCVRAWRNGSGVMMAPSIEMTHGYHRDSRHAMNLRDRSTRLHWLSISKYMLKYPQIFFFGRLPSARSVLEAS